MFEECVGKQIGNINGVARHLEIVWTNLGERDRQLVDSERTIILKLFFKNQFYPS